MQEVLFSVENGVGWIKLNRPRAINALTLDMVEAIGKQLQQWKEDEQVALICLYGEGEKGLCAGGDMRSLYEKKGTHPEESALPFFLTEYQMDLDIHRYPKPILAYMTGIVMGGGVGISIGCSHRIVTETTKWAMPEMNIGFFPDVGASYFFNQMKGNIGKYLALTSEMIQGADAIYLGAADRFIKSEQWEDLKRAIQETDWTKGSAEEKLDRLLDRFFVASPSSAIARLQNKIDQHFSLETVEQILASLDEAGDEWAVQTAQVIRAKSPTSLKVALRQIQEGKGKTLKECLEMELTLVMHFMQSHDFYEGVRAVLVDKDRNPKWQPDALELVTKDVVDAYFQYNWKVTPKFRL